MYFICPDEVPQPVVEPPQAEAVADDTGIDPGARVRPGDCANPRDVVRIGRVLVPTWVLAWGISIGVHAAVLLAACIAWRAYFRLGQSSAGDGGGGEGNVSLVADDSNAVQHVQLPGHSAALSDERRLPEGSHDGASLPDWHAAKSLATIAGESDSDVVPLIPALDTPDSGHPTFVRPASRGGAVRQPASRGDEGATGGGDAFTAPGLPTAFGGRGLPQPQYPVQARRLGQQGVVKVRVEILPDGHIGSIRVLSDPGFPLLREAALRAAEGLRDFQFAPARVNGRPVACPLDIPYGFVLR